MCGITGFVDERNKKEKKEIIKKMADRIIHRGPDADGYYISEKTALGHRRLSIIDIKNGVQPMYNENKKIIVVYNGEIYNFKELREELKNNHKFTTNSDTEVLLHGYEQWGTNLPKKLRGMFAFAIWDEEKQELFCARDNFGIKPFYYYQNGKTFLFASEIKSFKEHPDFKCEMDYDLIEPYLAFNFTPTTKTFFKGVNRLDPGHYLIYKNGKIKVEEYFKLKFEEKNEDYQTVVDNISNIMTDSCQKHMISDVPVGSFLSSGVDSSYLVSLAKPDNTYTVGYDIARYNEIDYAKDLTKRLKIKNTSKKISKEEYLKIVPKIVYHMDEPLADPAAIALYFVANLASKDLKVVLSGEGADELFGGYNYYREEVDMSFYNKIPFFIRRIIAKFCMLLPEIRGINFLVRRGLTLEENYIGVNRVFSDKEAHKIVKIKSSMKNSDITAPIFEQQKGKSNIVKMQAIDIHFWLIKDILHKADRMTMANSLEGRVPFVDKEVFEVAKKLTLKDKVSKANTKVALRDAAKKVIPNESYKKKKLGFPVPLRSWIKEEDFYNEVKRAFETDFAKEIFETKKIIKMLDDHKNGKKDCYKKLWTMYTLIIWHEVFFEDKKIA